VVAELYEEEVHGQRTVTRHAKYDKVNPFGVKRKLPASGGAANGLEYL